MTRLLAIARIQLVNWRMAIALPLGLVAVLLLLSLAVFATLNSLAVSSGFTDGFATGGATALYVFAAVVGLQAVTQHFRFALGLSVTRRAFLAATWLYSVAQAMVFGLVMTVGLAAERGTGGWGLGMEFFAFGVPPQDNLAVHWLIYVAVLLVSSAVGLGFGTVYTRWGQPGVYAVLVGVAVLVTGAIVIISLAGAWLTVATTVAGQPPLALGVGYPLLLAAVLGGAGWVALRRATP